MTSPQPVSDPTLPQAAPQERVEDLELFKKTSFDRFNEVSTDELVIALCGPIGSPLHHIADALETTLKSEFHYAVKKIRLSEFISRHSDPTIPPGIDGYEKRIAMIQSGNALRDQHGPAILAELAVSEIALWREERKQAENAQSHTPSRTCHVIDSIKNQQEMELLRKVYGDMLYCIGVFSPLQYRVTQLEEEMTLSQVYELIDIDSGEEKETGQMVDKTFFRSDYFLRVDGTTLNQIETKLKRFLTAVVTPNVVTPSPNETAMYSAAAAAWNSACMARQVGAAIVSASGELISVGWNDVPKHGGGLYRTQEGSADNRCFLWDKRVCHNDKGKEKIEDNIAKKFAAAGIIGSELLLKAREVIKSEIKSLIEFCRAIHAEMYALISAAHSGTGERLKGAKLFCTTYPCHSCARHLIAAGIQEIYYIEPYPKSKATTLHLDAITENELENDKVKLIPYDGVAPRKYRDLFEMKMDRKKQGRVTIYPKTGPIPSPASLESFPFLESQVVKTLRERKLL